VFLFSPFVLHALHIYIFPIWKGREALTYRTKQKAPMRSTFVVFMYPSIHMVFQVTWMHWTSYWELVVNWRPNELRKGSTLGPKASAWCLSLYIPNFI
jgi:hypothetical protein